MRIHFVRLEKIDEKAIFYDKRLLYGFRELLFPFSGMEPVFFCCFIFRHFFVPAARVEPASHVFL
jgi:hypothetical protein